MEGYVVYANETAFQVRNSLSISRRRHTVIGARRVQGDVRSTRSAYNHFKISNTKVIRSIELNFYLLSLKCSLTKQMVHATFVN